MTVLAALAAAVLISACGVALTDLGAFKWMLLVTVAALACTATAFGWTSPS